MRATITKWTLLLALIALAGPVRADDPVSTTSLGTSEVTPSSGKWNPQWRLFSGGIESSQGKDEGATALLRLRGKFDYQMTPWLKIHLQPVADLYAGRVQERFDDDTYQSKIWLSDTYLSVQPSEYVELRGGAIGQHFLALDGGKENVLLVGYSHAFPGAQEILSSDIGRVKVRAIAQQVVPTSYSMNTERTDREALPSFQTQSLHVDGENFNALKWSAMFGHYSWRNIPDAVAFDSEIVGNTGNGSEVAPGAKLRYGLDGLMWGWNADYRALIWLGVDFGYQGIVNNEAPSAAGHGQLWSLGPRFYFGDESVSLKYSNYFLESDATLAVYARPSMGYCNRIGDMVDVSLDFKDKGFALFGRWVNARPLVANTSQQIWNYFELGVETKYAPF